MDEKKQAQRFSEAVDRMFDTGTRPPADQDDGETLETAQMLAEADFSSASRVRESLRRDLLEESQRGEDRRALSRPSLPWLRWRTLAMPTAIAIALLVVALAFPGALTAAAEGVEGLVRELFLGGDTTVRQIDPADTPAGPEGLRDLPSGEGGYRIWIAKTTVREATGGRKDPPAIGVQREFAGFDEAQAAVRFDLKRPAHLPEGYSLRSVRVAPTGWVFAEYEGPNGPMLLAQVSGVARHRQRPAGRLGRR